MTDGVDDKRNRELDPVEFDLARGDRGSGLEELLLDRPRHARRVNAALAGNVAGERRKKATEPRGGVDTAHSLGPGPVADDIVDAAEPRVRLLEEDPDLARELPEPVRSTLTEQLWVQVLEARAGLWAPPSFEPGTTFGLLMLDGLIGRRVQVQRAVAVELVGTGDLIRPWARFERWDGVPSAMQWQVFAPARLAVLDERVTALIARRPELMIAFTDRLLRRLRAMSSLMAISHMTRVEDRLLGTLWQIASGCGRVTPEGVRIPIRLTHRVLAELVGAKRPSVTVALQQLRQRGEVTRGTSGDYILAGRPGS